MEGGTEDAFTSFPEVSQSWEQFKDKGYCKAESIY